ncbi:MAG: HupE/UreJ family protein [Flavobacteriaceae bacterium]|nr:HupE/UreJ family protein [Flavobacteriaceae bacterium]
MSEFWFYINLGIQHVLDWNAYDHILFLTALVVSYNFKDWKKVFWLVIMFTLGHSISLGLAAYQVVQVDEDWVEFLIAVSILVTAFFSIFKAGKNSSSTSKFNLLYLVTLFFGLIHGFGFSSYFLMISDSVDNLLVVLLQFAIGIEIAHILTVLTVLLLSFIAQRILRVSKRDWILIVSSIVAGLAAPILKEVWIW